MKVQLEKYGSEKKVNTIVVFAGTQKSKGKESLKVSGLLSVISLLKSAYSDKSFKASKGECFLVRNCAELDGKNLLAVGVGETSGMTLETMRNVSATAFGRLAQHKLNSFGYLLDSLLQ